MLKRRSKIRKLSDEIENNKVMDYDMLCLDDLKTDTFVYKELNRINNLKITSSKQRARAISRLRKYVKDNCKGKQKQKFISRLDNINAAVIWRGRDPRPSAPAAPGGYELSHDISIEDAYNRPPGWTRPVPGWLKDDKGKEEASRGGRKRTRRKSRRSRRKSPKRTRKSRKLTRGGRKRTRRLRKGKSRKSRKSRRRSTIKSRKGRKGK